MTSSGETFAFNNRQPEEKMFQSKLCHAFHDQFWKNFHFLWHRQEELLLSMKGFLQNFHFLWQGQEELSMTSSGRTFAFQDRQAEAKVFQSKLRQSLVNQDDWPCPWPILFIIIIIIIIIINMIMSFFIEQTRISSGVWKQKEFLVKIKCGRYWRDPTNQQLLWL